MLPTPASGFRAARALLSIIASPGLNAKSLISRRNLLCDKIVADFPDTYQASASALEASVQAFSASVPELGWAPGLSDLGGIYLYLYIYILHNTYVTLKAAAEDLGIMEESSEESWPGARVATALVFRTKQHPRETWVLPRCARPSDRIGPVGNVRGSGSVLAAAACDAGCALSCFVNFCTF